MTDRSTTIRVSLDQREVLRGLAQRRSASISQTLDDALASLRREDFFARMARAEADLQAEPAQWRAYVEERDAWLEPDLAGP